MAQHLEAHGLEARAQLARAGHGAGVQQRLMLPGPGVLTLVVGEGADAGHEQAALAARPQAHIHLVEPPGGGVHGEQMHDALRQAHEEQLVVDRLGAARFLAVHRVSRAGTPDPDPRNNRAPCRRACRSRRADIHRPPRGVLPAQGHAELRGDLAPAELQGALDDELGDIGEPVAHLHERHKPVRSATATRNSAALWNWRRASTCCSGSSSRSCSRRASRSRATRHARAAAAADAHRSAHRAAAGGWRSGRRESRHGGTAPPDARAPGHSPAAAQSRPSADRWPR